ncbi:hypothetical protein [Streptomyces sp. SHP 1-2]|uniref:hypothetical protein n=1 Tax=Streptomyces sp. SHP 1-2 TaxID=2769489 RepID=UPI002237C63A|nr:hypothetical protein [Streptomyces sp. SHP 1-2]MCW5249833.1 hypothetical protein [Streptomyces sp. SHP 1-2]
MAGPRELRHPDLRENAPAEAAEPPADLPLLRRTDLRSNRLGRLPGRLVRMPSPEELDLRWNGTDPSLPLLAPAGGAGCVALT